MTTLKAYEFVMSDRTHTGPIYYGTGKLPYTAAFKGEELKNKSGRLNRTFKTAEAAARAIAEMEG